MSHHDINRREMLLAAGAAASLLGLGAVESSAAEGCKSPSPKYHHIGLPTQKQRPKEKYLADSKVYITDPADDPFRIEWCRWLPDSPASEKLKTWPHIAFQVDDVEKELAKYDASQVVIKPFAPLEGLKVAFIDHQGQLIEFLQIAKS